MIDRGTGTTKSKPKSTPKRGPKVSPRTTYTKHRKVYNVDITKQKAANLPWIQNPKKTKGSFNFGYEQKPVTPSGHKVNQAGHSSFQQNKADLPKFEKFHQKNETQYKQEQLDILLKSLRGQDLFRDPKSLNSVDMAIYDPKTGMNMNLNRAIPLMLELDAVPEEYEDMIYRAQEREKGRFSYGKDDSYFQKLNDKNYDFEMLFNPETQKMESMPVMKYNAKAPEITIDYDVLGDYYEDWTYQSGGHTYPKAGAPMVPVEFDEEGNITKVNYNYYTVNDDGTFEYHNYSDKELKQFDDEWKLYLAFSNYQTGTLRDQTEKMEYTAGWDPDATDSIGEVLKDQTHHMLTKPDLNYFRKKGVNVDNPNELAPAMFWDDVQRLFKGTGNYFKTYLFTPLRHGDISTGAMNGLVNLMETCDYAGVGSRALFAPVLDEIGFSVEYNHDDTALERLGKAYTTHNTFEPNSGNAVKDMATWVFTDPAFLFTLGGMSAAKLTARAGSRRMLMDLNKRLAMYNEAVPSRKILGREFYLSEDPIFKEYKAISRDLAFADKQTLDVHAGNIIKALEKSNSKLLQNTSATFLRDSIYKDLVNLQNQKLYFFINATSLGSEFVNSIDNMFLAGGLYLPYSVIKTVKGTRAILRNNKKIAEHLTAKSFEKFQNAQRAFKNAFSGGSILDFHGVVQGIKDLRDLDATESFKTGVVNKYRPEYLKQQRNLKSALSRFKESKNDFSSRLATLNFDISKIFKISETGQSAKNFDQLEKLIRAEAEKARGMSHASDDVFDNMLSTLSKIKEEVELAEKNDIKDWTEAFMRASSSFEVLDRWQQYIKVNSDHYLREIEEIATNKYKMLAAAERGIEKDLVEFPDLMASVNIATKHNLDSVPGSKSSIKNESIDSEVTTIAHHLGDTHEYTQKQVINIKKLVEDLVVKDADGNIVRTEKGGVKFTVQNESVKELYDYLSMFTPNSISKASLDELIYKFVRALDSLKGSFSTEIKGLPTSEEMAAFMTGSEEVKEIFVYSGGFDLQSKVIDAGGGEYFELVRTIEDPTKYLPKEIDGAKDVFNKDVFEETSEIVGFNVKKSGRTIKNYKYKYVHERNKAIEEAYRKAKRISYADPNGNAHKKIVLRHHLNNVIIKNEDGIVTTAYQEYVKMVGEYHKWLKAKGETSDLLHSLDIALNDLVNARALTTAQAEKAYEVNMALSTFLEKTLNNSVIMDSVRQFDSEGPYGFIDHADELEEFLNKNIENGRDIPYSNKLFRGIDSLKTWRQSLDAYSNFSTRIDSLEFSPFEAAVIRELVIGKSPNYIREVATRDTTSFIRNLEENINIRLGDDNLLLDGYRETMLRDSFTNENIWRTDHLDYVMACKDDLVEISKSDVKTMILQDVEMDADAIKRFNSLAEDHDVYFLRAVTEDGSPDSAIIRIELQKWVPVDEDIKLPDLLKVLKDENNEYTHVFEVSEKLSESSALEEAIGLLDKSVKSGPKVKHVKTPFLVTHGRDVYDIDVLRRGCYRNSIASAMLSDTNYLFRNRINTFKELMMKDRNHTCIDPDKIPKLQEAVSDFFADLPEDPAYSIFNISRYSKDLDTVLGTLSDRNFIKEVMAVYDTDNPVLKALGETQKELKAGRVDEYDEKHIIDDIIQKFKIIEGRESVIETPIAKTSFYKDKTRLEYAGIDNFTDLGFSRLTDDIITTFEGVEKYGDLLNNKTVENFRNLPQESIGSEIYRRIQEGVNFDDFDNLVFEFADAHASILKRLRNTFSSMNDDLYRAVSFGFDDYGITLKEYFGSNLSALKNLLDDLGPNKTLFTDEFISKFKDTINSLIRNFEFGEDSIEFNKCFDLFLPEIDNELNHLDSIVGSKFVADSASSDLDAIKRFTIKEHKPNISLEDLQKYINFELAEYDRVYKAGIRSDSGSFLPGGPLPMSSTDYVNLLKSKVKDSATLDKLIKNIGETQKRNRELVEQLDNKIYEDETIILPETAALYGDLSTFINSLDYSHIKYSVVPSDMSKLLEQFNYLEVLTQKYARDINIPGAIINSLSCFSETLKVLDQFSQKELRAFVYFIDEFRGIISDLFAGINRSRILDSETELQEVFIALNQKSALIQHYLLETQDNILNRTFKESLKVTETSPFIKDFFTPAFSQINSVRQAGSMSEAVKEEVRNLDHIRSTQISSCLNSEEFQGYGDLYANYGFPMGTSSDIKLNVSGDAFGVQKAYDLDNASKTFDIEQSRAGSEISENVLVSDVIKEASDLIEEAKSLEDELASIRSRNASYRSQLNKLDLEKNERLISERDGLLEKQKDYVDVSEYDEAINYYYSDMEKKLNEFGKHSDKYKKAKKRYLETKAEKNTAKLTEKRIKEINDELADFDLETHKMYQDLLEQDTRTLRELEITKQGLIHRLTVCYEFLKRGDINDSTVITKGKLRAINSDIQHILETTDTFIHVPVTLHNIPAHELRSINKFANRIKYMRDYKLRTNNFLREISTIEDWMDIINQTKKFALGLDSSSPYHYLIYLKEPDSIEEAFLVADMLYNMFYKNLDQVKSIGMKAVEKEQSRLSGVYGDTASKIMRAGFDSVRLNVKNPDILKLLQGDGLDLVYKGVPKQYLSTIYHMSKINGKHSTAANISDILKAKDARMGWANKFTNPTHSIREQTFEELENSQIKLLEIIKEVSGTKFEEPCRKYLNNMHEALTKVRDLKILDFITRDSEHLLTHLLYYNGHLNIALKYTDETYGKYLTKLKEILDENPLFVNYKYETNKGYLWISLSKDATPKILNDSKYIKADTQFELGGKIYDSAEMNEFYEHIGLPTEPELIKGIISDKDLLSLEFTKYCSRIRNYISECYSKINFLSEGAIKGSAISPYSLAKHRALRKVAPVDWLANSIRGSISCDQRMFHTSQFDFNILGESEFRLKLGGQYDDTDILQNIKHVYDDLVGTVSTERMYIANFFDESSHCKLSNIFGDEYSTAQKLRILKEHPDQCVLTIVTDKNTLTGFRVEKIKITDELSVKQAEAAHAIVADYETYVEMTKLINNSEFDKTWMKVWARVVFFLKVGHLCNPGTWLRNWIDASIKATSATGNIGRTAVDQVTAMRYLFQYNKLIKEIRDSYGIHHNTSKRLDNEWEAIQKRTGTTLTKKQFDFIEDWLKISLSGGESHMIREMLKKQKYDPWRSGNLKPGNSFTYPGVEAMQKEADYIGSDLFRFEQIGEDEITRLIEEGYRKGEEIFVKGFSPEEFWHIFNLRKNPETSQIETNLYNKYVDTVENILTIRSKNLYRKNRGLGSKIDYMCSCFLKPMSMVEQVVRLGQFLSLEKQGYSRSEIFKSIADTQFEYELKSNRVKGAELFMTYFNFEYNNLRYWCNMLEEQPEFLYMLEDFWGATSWEAAQSLYENENFYENPSLAYMMYNGALPIGDSGLYLKMFPSALGALNWFYGMPSQFATSVVPPVEILLKELAYRMGGDYAQLVLDSIDYSYSDQTAWEKALAMVPIAGTIYTRYIQHFKERQPWTRLDDGTLGQELVKWNPTVWGAIYQYNKPHKDDFDAFQAKLAEQNKWYDSNLDKVVDIKYKNTRGLNNPELQDDFNRFAALMRLYRGRVWDANWGGFKKQKGHFTTPGSELFYDNGDPKELGLNRYHNFSIPGEWEKFCADKLKYHNEKWDYNKEKFVPASEWKNEKLNRDDLTWEERQFYMAEKGKYWDPVDHKFKHAPEVIHNYNRAYYHRGWREFKRWVNYGNHPPADSVNRKYNSGTTFKVYGKPFGYSYSSSHDYAALRMAVSGYKAYDEYYKFDYQYNYSYRNPNTINRVRGYNPIIRYHIIPT